MRSSALDRNYTRTGDVVIDLEALNETAARAATGQPHAVNDLLLACQPLVLGRCRKFLPNERDAEEACQDTLLAVSRNISTFESRSQFTTWLHRVTTNACIDCYRKLKRRRSVLGEQQPEAIAPGSTPSVMVGARIDLLEAVNEIDPKMIEPVLLRDLCELDYGEIALVLDVPIGTVKSRVHSGRKRLRHELYG